MAKNRVIALPKGSSPNFINGNVTGASDLYQAFINDARLEITWLFSAQCAESKYIGQNLEMRIQHWRLRRGLLKMTLLSLPKQSTN